MNKHGIETARSKDLRLSRDALERAARRAEEVARQTGTDLIVAEKGVLRRISPSGPDAPEPSSDRVRGR
jgi:hypothetical protein